MPVSIFPRTEDYRDAAFMRYFDAVYWIAHNDEPDEFDPKTVEGFLTTLLVADVFATSPKIVAADIITERRTRSE